jgi:PAS domain S-box-containing protein
MPQNETNNDTLEEMARRDATLLRGLYLAHLVSWPILFFLNDGVLFKITALVTFLNAVIALRLIQKQNLAVPRMLAAPTLLIAIFVISFPSIGLFDAVMLACPIVLLVAGTCFGRTAILYYTAAIVGLFFITAYLQLNGHITAPTPAYVDWRYAVNLSIIVAAFSLVLWGVMAIMAGDIARAKKVENLYGLVAENVRDVVWTMDLEGKVLFCSPAIFKQRGFRPNEIVGKDFNQYSTEETTTALKNLLAEELARDSEPDADRDRISALELEVLCKDKSRIWVEIVSSFLRDEDGKPIGVLGVSRDIDERKRSEQTRRSLESQIQQMQKMESLGVLAGGIAHDFNNLLVGIMGNSELTLDTLPEGSVGRTYLEQTLTSSKQAADLCQQLLAYSGQGRFVIEAIDLSETVEEMLSLLQVTLPKDVHMICNFDESAPPIEADATQIKQAIMNLVINAADAIGKDTGGTITISVGTQRVKANDLSRLIGNPDCRRGKYLFLEVTDTGCGMDKETLAKMFDPFFSTKDMGHGLGLSAILGIVRGHSGAITVDSKMGEGTQVRLLLPAQKVVLSKPAETSRSDVRFTGGTILVVDDESFVRTFAETALKSKGYQTLSAANGKEAVDIFKDKKDQIDAVLMDLTMPVMNGQEACTAMQRIDPDVSIVLASGFSEPDLVAQFGGNGTIAFLQKPYMINVLFETIESVIAAGVRS